MAEAATQKNNMVFSAYGLVRNIMQNLPMADLRRLSRYDE